MEKDTTIKATKLFILVTSEESYKLILDFGFKLITSFNESKGTIWLFENKDMPRETYLEIVKHNRSITFTDKMYFPK